MSDVAISLEDLRNLWRQAHAAWVSAFGDDVSQLFRGYVREEIARRTIADLRDKVAELTAQVELDAVFGKPTRMEMEAQIERLIQRNDSLTTMCHDLERQLAADEAVPALPDDVEEAISNLLSVWYAHHGATISYTVARAWLREQGEGGQDGALS